MTTAISIGLIVFAFIVCIGMMYFVAAPDKIMSIFRRGSHNKNRPLTPKEVLVNTFEQMKTGQVLFFKCSETWGDDFVSIELNPRYPDKGEKKFLMCNEANVKGMPSEIKKPMFSVEKPLELANWIIEREVRLFAPVLKEQPVTTDKLAEIIPEEEGKTLART